MTVTLADLQARLEALLTDALARWRAIAGDDLRVRLGGAFAGGLVLGKVVRRLGR